MSGYAALETLARRLRGLEGLAEQAAKDAAPELEKIVKDSAAAGTDLEGKAWRPKVDGTRALPNAPSAISAVAHGAVVTIKLIGNYVYHNNAKGKSRRQILPSYAQGISPQIKEAMKDAAQRAFARLMKR